jgi:N-acetyl-alpha-D-muramate 1-phosphate uridylyltransferase
MKAMILAAGRGERMRPLTDHTPKPMLMVGGKPLIAWTIERLVRAQILDLVINHAHLGAQIERGLGNGAQFGASITYSPESQALETAGGIAQARAKLGDDPFIVVNGDIYCEFDFAALAARARALPARIWAHLVLVANPSHNLKGDFSLENGMVRDPTDGVAQRLTFAGIGLYRPQLFDAIQPGNRAALAPVLRQAMAANRVSGELCRERWVDVGTPERLGELDNTISARS